MIKQKNKAIKFHDEEAPITVSTQLPPKEVEDIRDLCNRTGHKMAFILRVLIRHGLDRLEAMPEKHGRTAISESGPL